MGFGILLDLVLRFGRMSKEMPQEAQARTTGQA